LPENAEQIAIPFFSKGSPRFRKKIAIKLRKGEHPFVSLVAIAFALKQSTKAVEMPEITIAQKRIAQHCAQRGRYRQSDLEANAPPKQSLHHLQQWYVALADRLEKPVVFGAQRSEADESRSVAVKVSSRDPSVRSGLVFSLGMSSYKVRQKSWKRSRPFLIISMLVA
jgi:hypothetical protein